MLSKTNASAPEVVDGPSAWPEDSMFSEPAAASTITSAAPPTTSEVPKHSTTPSLAESGLTTTGADAPVFSDAVGHQGHQQSPADARVLSAAGAAPDSMINAG